MEVLHTLGYETVKADLFRAASAHGSAWCLSSMYVSSALVSSARWDFRALVAFYENDQCSICSRLALLNQFFSYALLPIRISDKDEKLVRDVSPISRLCLIFYKFFPLLLPIKMERGEIATRTTFVLTAPLFYTLLTSNFPSIFFIVRLNFIRWLHVGYLLKIPSGKWKITEKQPKTT